MKKIVTLFLLSTFIHQDITAQSDTLQWTVLMAGSTVGYLKQLKNADDTCTEWFKFNDRGRGDSTVVTYKVNEAGIITWLDAKGVDYLKAPVFEKYQLNNGVATWENPDEKETKKVSGPVEYVPLKVNAGISVKAYLNAPNQTLQLLPAGQRTLTVIKEVSIQGKRLRLISLVGASLQPSYQWIDERDNFFGYPSDWRAYIAKGYEHLNDTLLSMQRAVEQDYFKKIASTVREKTQQLAVTNANLFDSKTGKVSEKITILIRNGRIHEIGAKSVPSGYSIIDAAGKFVMPGLWDMHVHYAEGTDGILHLANGVTNVRDMGNSDALPDQKKLIDEGVVLGPRIQAMCGFIDGKGPFSGPAGAKITSVEEGISAVRNYKQKGYSQVKLYSSMKPEWVKPIAEEAHKLGLRVSGHIPAHMLASEAVNAGYDEIQHMNMLFLNFMGKELDTRTPVRFHAVAQNAAKMDLKSAETKAFIDLLKAKKTVIDPTISFFETMFIPQSGKPIPTMAAVIDRLPLDLQRAFRSGGALQVPEGQESTYAESYQKMLQLVKILFDNGVTIVPGTDDVAGFVLHKELENYSKAGIPNAEILRLATIGSAKVAGRDKEFGTIEIGRIADIIIIDGNPLEKMEQIRRVETIVKGDEVYKSKDLLKAVSISYFK